MGVLYWTCCCRFMTHGFKIPLNDHTVFDSKIRKKGLLVEWLDPISFGSFPWSRNGRKAADVKRSHFLWHQLAYFLSYGNIYGVC